MIAEDRPQGTWTGFAPERFKIRLGIRLSVWDYRSFGIPALRKFISTMRAKTDIRPVPFDELARLRTDMVGAPKVPRQVAKCARIGLLIVAVSHLAACAQSPDASTVLRSAEAAMNQVQSFRFEESIRSTRESDIPDALGFGRTLGSTYFKSSGGVSETGISYKRAIFSVDDGQLFQAIRVGDTDFRIDPATGEWTEFAGTSFQHPSHGHLQGAMARDPFEFMEQAFALVRENGAEAILSRADGDAVYLIESVDESGEGEFDRIRVEIAADEYLVRRIEMLGFSRFPPPDCLSCGLFFGSSTWRVAAIRFGDFGYQLHSGGIDPTAAAGSHVSEPVVSSSGQVFDLAWHCCERSPDEHYVDAIDLTGGPTIGAARETGAVGAIARVSAPHWGRVEPPGFSAAVHGDVIALATTTCCGKYLFSNLAIFENDRDGSWRPAAEFRIPGVTLHPEISVDVAADYIAVGIPGFRQSGSCGTNAPEGDSAATVDCPVGKSGAVYVIGRQGSSWSTAGPIAFLEVPELPANSRFGYSVSADDGLIAVGLGNGSSAFLFQEPESGWSSGLEPIALETGAGDLIGGSIAVGDGTVVMAGGRPHAEPVREPGAAWLHVFEMPAGGWESGIEPIQIGPLSAGRGPVSASRYWVSLRGNLLAFGQHYPTQGSDVSGKGPDGTVLVFERPREGWNSQIEPTWRLDPEELGEEVGFGRSVALTDGGAVVGSDIGRAFYYELSKGVPRPRGTIVSTIGGNSVTRGGRVVDWDGGQAIVGYAAWEHVGAYVYRLAKIPDLQISISETQSWNDSEVSFDTPTYRHGPEFTRTLRVLNDGLAAANQIELDFELGWNEDLISITPATGECTGTMAVVCKFDKIEPGEEFEVEVRTRISGFEYDVSIWSLTGRVAIRSALPDLNGWGNYSYWIPPSIPASMI